MRAGTLSHNFTPDDDAISLLCSDHARIALLFEAFDKIKGSEVNKALVVKLICIEVRIHSLVEEQVFYPAASAALRDPLVFDRHEVVHALATQLTSELGNMTPGDPGFDAKVYLLRQYLDDHGEQERQAIFPRVAKTGVDLRALGTMIRLRKQDLLRRERHRLARQVMADPDMTG